MSDQYGLRSHNRRVVNPETRTRSKLYYETRFYVRGVVQILVACFWAAVIIGALYGVYSIWWAITHG